MQLKEGKMKKLIGAVALAGLISASSAIADNSNVPVTLAMFGDWPYSYFLLSNANLLINAARNWAP
jgi:hypothetical protein